MLTVRFVVMLINGYVTLNIIMWLLSWLCSPPRRMHGVWSARKESSVSHCAVEIPRNTYWQCARHHATGDCVA